MKAKTEMSAQQQAESGAPEQQKSEAPNVDHVPRKLTFAQNVIGTIKVLAIAGLVIAALWVLDLWASSK
jgi:hypothetical protein